MTKRHPAGQRSFFVKDAKIRSVSRFYTQASRHFHNASHSAGETVEMRENDPDAPKSELVEWANSNKEQQ